MNEAARSAQDRGWIYRELGVTPVLNCAGVRTQFGGSNPAPEVQAAMLAASDSFVDLDELAIAAGERLANLTGAEWGVITAGTTAALSLATAACIAGNDPDLMLRLPRTQGMPNRVLMPAGQRFDYDHAIAAAGGVIECVADLKSLEALLDGTSVMICLLARRDSGELTLGAIAPIARRHDVPILVDAAGLTPTRPDRWLAAGADLVVYSGGKYLRGPQSTGVLLGRRSLCEAAWLNGPPHQSFGRAMKVGKEEIVGAVTAVERWLSSPLARRERLQWVARVELMRSSLCGLPGLTLTVLPATEFVTATRLRVAWDPARVPLTSETLRTTLLAGSPRVLIHDFWCTPHSLVLDPVNLSDDEAKRACSAIRAALTRTFLSPAQAHHCAPVDLTGTWNAQLTFLRGAGAHRLQFEQQDERLAGQHRGRHSTGSLSGQVTGNSVSFVARHENGGLPFYYSFEGVLNDDTLSGRVLLGAASDEHLGPVFQTQFGTAHWHASRSGSN